MTAGSRPPGAARIAGLGTTIFAEVSARAAATGAINLGQGFPDYPGPEPVLRRAAEAIAAGDNQYPPGRGTDELRAAIAAHQAHFYGLELDGSSQVLVTMGATEAIAAALLALCDPGDEVVVFEPLYDSYQAAAALAGAVLRPVRLHAPSWSFRPDELEAAVTARTRLVLCNSPHNPTGKVFAAEELEQVAQVCCRHDLLAVTDEVYEHLVFSGRHVPLATLPEMAGRTLTISSAGKSFSVTGWKIGWATGPAELVDAVAKVKQFLTYAGGTPFQPAVALGLRLGDDWFAAEAAALAARRDLLCDALEAIGAEVLRPDGTYFAQVDARSLGFEDGARCCVELLERHGVAAIPSQVFYLDEEAGRPYVRFAFCKRPEVLAEAVRRLVRP